MQLIVVDSDGELLSSANGHVSGEPGTVKIVKENVLLGEPVLLIEPYSEKVASDLDISNPISIVAALFSVRPGRSRLLKAPPEVWEWFDKNFEKYGEPASSEQNGTI